MPPGKTDNCAAFGGALFISQHYFWEIDTFFPIFGKIDSKMTERGKKSARRQPIRAVWNSILACIVFDHHSIKSLRRELSRNLSYHEERVMPPFHGRLRL